VRKRKVFTVLYPTVPTLNYQYHKFLRCRHPHINLSREDRLSRKRKRRENEADYILGLQHLLTVVLISIKDWRGGQCRRYSGVCHTFLESDLS
jgi:hypothetical protein